MGINLTKSNSAEYTELEYNANRYTVKCLRVMLVALFLVWAANTTGIFVVNKILMSVGIAIAAAMVVITLKFAGHADLRKPWVKYVMLFFTVVAVTVLGVTLTYHTLLLSVLPLILAAQYSNSKVTTYTYICTVVSMCVIVLGGYKWGLCDANMIIATTEPASVYINKVLGGGALEISKVNLPLFFILPRCILLLLLLPVIRSISLNIMSYAEYAVNMKNKSERDDMTGLYNKNKYIQMKKEKYCEERGIGIVFVDVNNLKHTNDTIGHAQGDYLITSTAQLLQRLLADNRKAYRTGGDEFVMIVTNPAEGEMEEIGRKWQELEEECQSNSRIPYSAAIGYAQGAGKDFERIEKKADDSMYKNKVKKKAEAEKNDN